MARTTSRAAIDAELTGKHACSTQVRARDDPDRAQDCLADYQALSCDVVRDGIEETDTPACSQVCQ